MGNPRLALVLLLAAVAAPSAFLGGASVARADDEPGDDGGMPEGDGAEPGEPGAGGDPAPEEPDPVDPKLKAKVDARIRKFIDSFKKDIHSADTATLAFYLQSKEIRALLVEDPVNCAVLCIEAAVFLARVPLKELEDAAKVAETFDQIATACLQKHADDRSAKIALAAAITCRVRIERAMGKPVAVDRWTKVADLILEAYTGGAPDSGGYAAKAVSWLREPVEEAPEIRPAIAERAEKLLAGICAIAEGATREIAKAQAQFLRATALGPAKGKADADAAIGTLAPYVKGDQPRMDAFTLHNEIVAWGKNAKIALKGNFIFHRANVLSTGLAYATPEGSRWEDQAATGNSFFRVVQTNHRGRILRQIQGDYFQWDANYRFDDEGKTIRIGGDNAKGLARKAFLDAKDKMFSSVTGQKDLVKAPFGKRLAQAQMFQVDGLDKDGQPMRMRGYFFKAKEAMLTYQIEVFEYGDFKKADPELDAFFDGMFEKPKEKTKPGK